jgi:glycosyltransferase involved in cell wall biosynthesis
MHIVFPMMGLSKSGGIRVIVQIANGLVKRGHKVTILLSRPIKKPSFPLDNLVHIKQSSISKKNVLAELWWLVRNIPNDADIVVANYYITSYPTAIVSLLGNKKGCYFIQGYEPDFFVKMPKGKTRIVQRILARISYNLPLYQITISTWLQGVLHDVTGHNAAVINDGVDTTIFSPRQGDKKSKDAKILMCLGRKDQKKGFSDLLDAVRILGRQLNLRLLIATQDKNIVVNSSVPTEIVCPADDEALASCYRRADVFVFPSLREGFGLPPLEAMACGKPVVTTDCGGVLDYVEDGINCLVVPVKDPVAMAEAIRKIIYDNKLAKRLSAGGRETACRFTWDEMVDKFENLLSNTLL